MFGFFKKKGDFQLSLDSNSAYLQRINQDLRTLIAIEKGISFQVAKQVEMQKSFENRLFTELRLLKEAKR